MRAERERARFRLHLVKHRVALKNRVHAILFQHGIPSPGRALFGAGGRRLLDRLALPQPSASTLSASLVLINSIDEQISDCERELRELGADHRYVPLLTTIPGIAWVLGYTIAAKIGDIGRFPSPRKLIGYTGLTPRVEQSGERDRRGPLRRNGPDYLRWALIEAAHTAGRHPHYRPVVERMRARHGRTRGSKIAAIEIARRLSKRPQRHRRPADGHALKCPSAGADLRTMKQVFNTSVGTIQVVLDRASRTVSLTRFDDEQRAVAAAIESWDYVDLRDVLNRQIGVPLSDASHIANAIRGQYVSSDSLAGRLNERTPTQRHQPGSASDENAGVALRFVAVLLDTVLVLFPLSLGIGLLSGGGYAVSGDGYANAGVDVSGSALWLLLGLSLAYYVVFEAMTGATLGKHMVGIRVVGEDGRHPSLAAAIGRNVLRAVDGLFFYLVGGLVALTSPRCQRLGDRAAHTLVVRR